MVEQYRHLPSLRLGGLPFKRGQLFVSHVNSSPHFVGKCPFYHDNLSPYKRGLGKRAAGWVYIEACAYPHGYTQLHRNLASTELNNRQIAWENSWHFSTTPLVSLWNDVCEMTAEISHCWGANTLIWVVLLIGRELRENCNQKHYSDLGSDTWRRQYEISAARKILAAFSSDHWDCFRKSKSWRWKPRKRSQLTLDSTTLDNLGWLPCTKLSLILKFQSQLVKQLTAKNVQ